MILIINHLGIISENCIRKMEPVLKTKYSEIYVWACYVLSAAIFTMDLFTPLSIADGVLYTMVIMLTIRIGNERSTLYAVLACTLLTVLGALFFPKGEGSAIFISNRFLAIAFIWSAAFVIIKFKKAEQNASRNRDSLRALFKYATEGIIISNQNGEITMANPQAEKQFGYDKGELINEKIEILVPNRYKENHSKKREQYYKTPHERYKGSGLELVGKRKDQSEFPVEISLSNYLMDGKLYVISFIIDITRRKEQQDTIKKANEDLLQSATELKRINGELENFAYVSSHDLQEPLRKIQSFGDRLKIREKDKLSEDGVNYLERMLNASARMQCLINDLLAFSRLSSQAQAFMPVNLNQILADVLSDLEISIEKNGARVSSAGLPVIEAEPTQMRQLFQNVIGNALKFKKDDEPPVINIFARQSDSATGDYLQDGSVQIFIEDNGIGFDEKYHDKIFNIFQRLDGRKYEGSGIGLAICKKIVDRHGGTIMAKSSLGKGTTFIITLPLRQNLKKEIKPELLTF